MKRADIISAGVIAVFGLLLLFVVIPIWVPRHEEGGYGLGAQVMPRVTATLVTGLAVLFFLFRLFGRREQNDAEKKEDATPPIPRSSWIFLGTASLFIIAMTAMFTWVGFLATALNLCRSKEPDCLRVSISDDPRRGARHRLRDAREPVRLLLRSVRMRHT